ncbi:MAG: hypothetical protein WC554_09950 [Clostridia bacterium]
MKDIHKINLINAKEMSILRSDTFDYYTDEILLLKIGDFVKISTGKERFWVEVESIDKDKLIGRIDNDLVTINEPKYDDLIEFTKENIFQVFSE